MLCRTIIGAALFLLSPAASLVASSGQAIASVAVMPVENLSARSAPTDQIAEALIARLVDAGVAVLPAPALADFMTRHRLRYTAGLDAATAASLSEETGVDAVVIAAVDSFNDSSSPKIGLFVRVVSLDGSPSVTWADDTSLSGDEAPGWLDLGLVDDYEVLLARALDRLSGSLVSFIKTGQAAERKNAGKFRPKITYNAVGVETGKVYSVAVLPFFNLADRRNAGEILAWLFTRHLSAFRAFRVLDTGEVRRQLLQARVIMDSGVSLADAELVGSLLDADFVLAGRVVYYQDYEGADGTARVDFSTVLIERRTRRVVWSSESYNDSNDGVLFFGRGRTTTAHAMATQMVGLATERIATGRK